MVPEVRQVLTEALKLSPHERAELVEQVLASFELPDREAIDALWAQEAEARIAAYERGEMGAIPASEVFDEIGRPPSE